MVDGKITFDYLTEKSRRLSSSYESVLELLLYQNALLRLIASAHHDFFGRFDDEIADAIRIVADYTPPFRARLWAQYGFSPRTVQEEDGTRYLVIAKADALREIVFKRKLPDGYSIGTWDEAKSILNERGVIRLIGLPFDVPVIIFKSFDPPCYVASINDNIAIYDTFELACKYVYEGWVWAKNADSWRVVEDCSMLGYAETERMKLKQERTQNG